VMLGVILYGPPAAGKDTVTRELAALEGDVQLFSRVKAGSGRTEGYRMVSREQLDGLRAHGELIWENSRYGAVYGVDRAGLLASAAHGVPVLHLGQSAAIGAVKRATPSIEWLVVSLWCPRSVAAARIAARNTGDDSERLMAWDETERPGSADLAFDTEAVRPEEVARAIFAEIRQRRGSR
jgi:guanylate kinase